MVRNIGVIEGNQLLNGNQWEEIKKGGNTAIQNWIDNNLKNKECTVVLIGTYTASRNWVNYEIEKSWNTGKGVVGLHIHGLEDRSGKSALKGYNPLDYVTFEDGRKLSTVAKTYDPGGFNGKEVYNWISKYLQAAVEEAIRIRNNI